MTQNKQDMEQHKNFVLISGFPRFSYIMLAQGNEYTFQHGIIAKVFV